MVLLQFLGFTGYVHEMIDELFVGSIPLRMSKIRIILKGICASEHLLSLNLDDIGALVDARWPVDVDSWFTTSIQFSEQVHDHSYVCCSGNCR